MNKARKRYSIRGIVQGVGFRPFVFAIARQYSMTGWVANGGGGVLIEVQGEASAFSRFRTALEENKPKNAQIIAIEESPLDCIEGETLFVIRASEPSEASTTFILPDLAACEECLRDILTPGNRRYNYPFASCACCGPRFSIIEKLPYDRKNTTMKSFPLCSECLKEYEDPGDRRFHAQPIACPACGPQCALWNPSGKVLAEKEEALSLACDLIRQGYILALKGIGGFQLIADAKNEQAAALLRARKQRPHKPFAVMYPGLEAAKEDCLLSPIEAELLTTQAAPIVIVKARFSSLPGIAPGSPYMGVMLPYSPLHHLLLRKLGAPVIATSGNRAEEPLCTDEGEALRELGEIADYFLIHNRPIAHFIDDSLVQVVMGEAQVLRRARGYASMPILIDGELPPSLAVGGQMKNVIAFARGSTVFLSQHLGDLQNEKGCRAFEKTIRDISTLHAIDPAFIVRDYHPDYYSSGYAAGLGKPLRECQHHAAHIYACMAENKLAPPLLGVAWDGTGYGLDGTIWGGEWFALDEKGGCRRTAALRSFPLPCGEKAVREPRFSALGLLYEIYGQALFDVEGLLPQSLIQEREKSNLQKMLSTGFLSPRCSSVGRIFDGVSALLELFFYSTFEGQAAMAVEFLAEQSDTEERYPFTIEGGEPMQVDWRPMIQAIMAEAKSALPKELIAGKFHNTLAEIIVKVAERCQQKTVAISGGAFQNRVLAKKTVEELRRAGFDPHWHRIVPPNDGGIALGQIFSQILSSKKQPF